MLTGLTRKVTLAAVVFLILITLVLVFVLVSMTRFQEATSHLNDELIPQLDAKGDFNTSVARVLGEVEAFLGSDQDGELEQAHESLAEAQHALASLTTLAAVESQHHDPEEGALAQAILERQIAMLATLQRVVTEAATPNAALGPQIDQLHTELTALEDVTDVVLDDHRGEMAEVLDTSFRAVYAGAGALGVLCIGLTLLALLMLRHAIVRPIVVLAGAAEQVAGGDLEQTVVATGGDEIGTLQCSFNTMVGTLHQQTQQLQQEVDAANTARQAAEDARAEIAAQLRTIDEQRAVIREMSVPILPLSERALVIPLVGTLDTARLRLALAQALQAIEQLGVRYALLDITGVPLIDTQVARGLLDIAQAARLLGAEVVMVGVRPEVAQTIVGLGLQLNTITVRSTLQEGILYALGRG